MFCINSIVARSTYSYGDACPWVVEVVVKMPAKEWARIRNKGHLGMLYGIDISNAVYGLNRFIPAHNPTVDDKERAKAGIKTIRLSYRLDNPARAKGLGLSFKQLSNGHIIADRSDAIRLDYAVPGQPRLALVQAVQS